MKALLLHQYNSFVSQQERPQLPVEGFVDVGEPEKESKDDVIDINVVSAVLFVLLASGFVMLLYFYQYRLGLYGCWLFFSASAALSEWGNEDGTDPKSERDSVKRKMAKQQVGRHSKDFVCQENHL